MSVRSVTVGRESFSLTHLKVFRREELEGVFGDLWQDVWRLAHSHVVIFKPLFVDINLCDSEDVKVGPGVALIFGMDVWSDGWFSVPALLDGDFLEYLLFDLPKRLDEFRSVVVVEDVSSRFTRDVEEGVSYALDVLYRVSRVYRVPVLVLDSYELYRRYTFSRVVGCRIGDDGKTYCIVDGEVVCVR